MSTYDIYPKQFLNKTVVTDKNKCFVLMPFAEEYDELYAIIKETAINLDLTCLRDDEIVGSESFMSKVLREIARSRYIIVVLTGSRPNVVYELGIAHSYKDVQNVILIAENEYWKKENLLTDIIHLTHILYDKNNIFKLKTDLKKSILSCKKTSEFLDALEYKNISIANCDKSFILSQIELNLKEHENDLIEMIYGNSIEPKVASEILVKMKNMIIGISQNNSENEYEVLLKLYFNILAESEGYEYGEIFVNDFIANGHNYLKGEAEILSRQTDLCVFLGEQMSYLRIIMPWMLQYLSQGKTARIDLNRYKIEKFLLSKNSEEVDSYICNSIMDNDTHKREHLSDIIGEKRIDMAEPYLCKLLKDEKNFYTARSIIEALAKIGKASSYSVIEEWLQNNEQEILSTKSYFVFPHIKRAIINLVGKGSEKFIQFKDEYSRYM